MKPKKYNSDLYKEWYSKNKDRIRSSKKTSKKKYRRTEAGRAAQRRYNAKESTKAYVRNYNSLKRYGITYDTYLVMLKSRDGRCDICANEAGKLHIDHCHKQGYVRGLLCGNCNRALGLLKDSTKYLQQAIIYLEQDV